MPKYYEDIEEKSTKPRLACEGIRDDLLECLVKSDCCKRDKNTPRQCLNKVGDPSVPDECHKLRLAFIECRRSMLDMRTRFRGRKE